MVDNFTKLVSIITEYDPCDYNHRWNLAKGLTSIIFPGVRTFIMGKIIIGTLACFSTQLWGVWTLLSNNRYGYSAS